MTSATHPWRKQRHFVADRIPPWIHVNDWEFANVDSSADDLLIQHAQQTLLTGARPITRESSTLDPLDELSCAAERRKNGHGYQRWRDLYRERKERANEQRRRDEFWEHAKRHNLNKWDGFVTFQSYDPTKVAKFYVALAEGKTLGEAIFHATGTEPNL